MDSSSRTVVPSNGIFALDWVDGPHSNSPTSAIVASFTDFRAENHDDLKEIFDTGIELGKNWPIMEGAIGLWLWGKPADLRGGSLSFWRSEADLRRFVGWRVHTTIIQKWRSRVTVRSRTWHDEEFRPSDAWVRAERLMVGAH